MIDEGKMVRTIAERLERTTNPRHRDNLETLLAHVTGEAERDVEKVMGSMAPGPVYRMLGAPASMSPSGYQNVRDSTSAGCSKANAFGWRSTSST